MGIDLQDYYISVEWDIMGVPAARNEKYYSCCEEPYPDIMFNITLRRKTLFYTVNLIIPCVGISFLSVLVFYLPSDSGEKMSLCISILLSLTVFFLLLAEIIPPTSLAVPLLGKYLLFTMILITFSVIVTICILNVNYRSPATHKMSPWVRTVFIETLPKFLFLRRPNKDDDEDDDNENGGAPNLQICHIHGLNPPEEMEVPFYPSLPSPIFLSESEAIRHNLGDVRRFPTEIEKSATNIRFVAQHMKNKDRFEAVSILSSY
jgi:nicotinic acetylcholine receptor